MVVGERELYRRFADYDDEELLRILTAERAKYRREALAAAEMVLAQRGVAPPSPFNAPEPPPTLVRGRARRKSPYQFIDLCVDALLVALFFWALEKLGDWTQTPGSVWGGLAYCTLAACLLGSVFSLRRSWRTKEWRD